MLFHSCKPTLAFLSAMLLKLAHVVPYIEGEQISPRVDRSIGNAEDCFPRTNDDFHISMNVTRSPEGDELNAYCTRGCTDLCHSAQAVRLMCDEEDSPTCRCKCPFNKTLRTDRLACVTKLNECNFPIFHYDVLSSTGLIVDIGAIQGNSQCTPVGVKDIGVIEGVKLTTTYPFVTSADDQNRINISLSSPGDIWRLSGRLLKVEVRCNRQASPLCIGVKFPGTLAHSTSFYLPNQPPSDMTHDLYKQSQEFQTSTALQTIGVTKSPEDEQLETIITGLCISVAVLMVIWLTCFLVEKKVQRKSSRNTTISTPTSSSKTYTYEVSSVRKTLMEMFDMPMIKIHSTEDNESRIRPSSVSSDKSESNEPDEATKSDSDGGTVDVFSPEPSGYSTSSSDDLKEASSDKSTLLDVPKHKPTASQEDFAHWIPKTHQFADASQDSPAKKENSPKNSPKRIKFGGMRFLDHHSSPLKTKRDIKLHPPILKSALKSSDRKKAANVRVTMEDEVVYTRPLRSNNSNNNYIEMESKEDIVNGGSEMNNIRESAIVSHHCTKL